MGDDATRRRCLVDLGGIALNEGDNIAAEALFKELLEACSLADDRFGAGIAHGNLAFVLGLRGDVAKAELEAREAIRLFTEIGEAEFLGWSLDTLASVLAETGRLEEAGRLALQALGISWGIGVVRDVAGCLDTLSSVALESGDMPRAVRLMTAARRIRTEADLSIAGLLLARGRLARLGLPRDGHRLHQPLGPRVRPVDLRWLQASGGRSSGTRRHRGRASCR